MQATITYLLTEQAQREQMAATGQPVPRKQTMTIEVTADDLPLLDVGADGAVGLDLSVDRAAMGKMARRWRAQVLGGDYTCPSDPPTFDSAPTPEYLRGEEERYWQMYRERLAAVEPAEWATYRLLTDDNVRDALSALVGKPRGSKLHDAAYAVSLLPPAAIAQRQEQLAAEAARLEAIEAKRQAAITTYLADPDARAQSRTYDEIRIGGVSIYKSHPSHQVLIDEDVRREKADTAATEAAAATKEAAKAAYIDTWVAEHASAEIRAQHADDMLCRRDAIALIADATFTGIEAATWVGDFCRDSDCKCGSETVKCLPTSRYAHLREIRQTLPQGHTCILTRVRECRMEEDNPVAAPAAYYADLTVQVGPFALTRRTRL